MSSMFSCSEDQKSRLIFNVLARSILTPEAGKHYREAQDQGELEKERK